MSGIEVGCRRESCFFFKPVNPWSTMQYQFSNVGAFHSAGAYIESKEIDRGLFNCYKGKPEIFGGYWFKTERFFFDSLT
jgi:hypothetical protein